MVTLLSIATALFAGLMMTRLFSRFKLPDVTAYLIAGILAGPFVLGRLGIPGLGRFLVASISHRDYPVVQAIVVILAFWVVLAGTISDIVNRRIDPRLRLGGEDE